MSETVPIFQNLSDNVITFETKEEFDRYYNKNKELIDSMKTRGINKKYAITGYKIGRQKGNIILYPINTSNQISQINSDDSMLELKIDNISERLKKIEFQLNSLLKLFTSK